MTAAAEHPAEFDERRLLGECRVERTRRSGPGGQHRNKVETAIVITHLPSLVRGEASERRSQEENRRQAIFRLRVNLAISLRRLREAAPSELWQSRLRSGRIEVNPEHDDFPALLAEALDVLAAVEMDISRAAGQLGCTSSQLIRFLKHEPRALQAVNAHRASQGLHALK